MELLKCQLCSSHQTGASSLVPSVVEWIEQLASQAAVVRWTPHQIPLHFFPYVNSRCSLGTKSARVNLESNCFGVTPPHLPAPYLLPKPNNVFFYPICSQEGERLSLFFFSMCTCTLSYERPLNFYFRLQSKRRLFRNLFSRTN